MTSFRLTILGFLLLVAGACATNQTGQPEVQGPETTILVENQNFNDMTIYLLERGRRTRLGTVTGLGSSTFVIPERALFGISSLRFQADPLGGSRTPITEEIAVSPGDQLRLRIPSS